MIFNILKCGTNLEFPHKTSHLEKYSNKTKSSYLDWYYSDSVSEEYPIRDITKLGKFEPHYEDGTFNVCRSCNQRFLNRALKDGISHIFFFTKYHGYFRNYRDKYFITGFFEIGKTCLIHQQKKPIRKAVIASRRKFLKISDALELSKIIKNEIRNARHTPKRLDEKTTKRILKYFSNKKDYTKQYITFTNLLKN